MRTVLRVRWADGAVLLAVLLTQLHGAPLGAQTEAITVDSPPAALARAAIGSRPGTAVAAVWRDGRLQQAGLRDGVPLPDELLAGDQAPLFEIGSISKVFTGLLLAQAVERGELSLDDTLGQRLQGTVALGSADAAAITLRQLVTHTACLPRMPADFGRPPARAYREYDRARLWSALAALKLPAPPPCAARYSNLGFAVLGELISLRLGAPWDQLVGQRISRPLGLQDTVQTLGDRSVRLAPGFAGAAPTEAWQMQAFAGAGALHGSAPDLVRLGRALMAGRDGPLGAAAERAVTPLLRGGPEIGHALMIRGPAQRRTWMHDGATGGYRTLWMVLPDRDQVIVVLTSNGAAAIGDLRSALLASRYPVTADNVTADSAPVDPQRLPDYAGVYRSDDGAALMLAVQDGALWARPVGLGFERLQGAGDDRFMRRNLTLYEFDRVDGQVQGLRSSGGGVERSFRRTAEPAPAVARQSAELLQAYVGRYSGSGLDFSVQQQDGVLRVKLGDQPRFPVFPVPGDADRFAYDVVQAELQFERYANGQVRALVLHQNGARRSAQRVD